LEFVANGNKGPSLSIELVAMAAPPRVWSNKFVAEPRKTALTTQEMGLAQA